MASKYLLLSPINTLKESWKKVLVQIIKIRPFLLDINNSKRTIVRKMIGCVLILAGVFSLFFISLPKENKPIVQTTVANEPIVASNTFEEKNSQSTVKRIVIPHIGIDLKVESAKLTNGYWETSETTASHGQFSANPGEKNNIVIFAHAREGLFGSIKDAEKNDMIYLLTKSGWFSYKIAEIKEVYPSQTEVIKPTKSEVLTLFTCSGYFDEKRLVIKAIPFDNISR